MATRERDVVGGSDTGLGSVVAQETHGELGVATQVRARGYWELVWIRFKRDKVAIASGIGVILLFIIAFVGAPIASRMLGHGPNDQFLTDGIDQTTLLPVGTWTYVHDDFTGEKELLPLGASDTIGRDEFLRLLYGAQVSLEVAILSTFFVMLIGTLLGSIAGYYRGWIDTGISRITEITMAFPALLFIIALAATIGPRLDKVTFGIFGEGVVTIVLIFSLFGWFYPCRIIRAQTLSIREKEYIEAGRMIGASDWRLIRSHVLPHLVAPMIVFSTLIVAQYILAEAGLSFLGLGIKPPTASWGNMLADSTVFYKQLPLLMIWPGLAVLVTTLAFNLLGDGLRDAFDPRATR